MILEKKYSLLSLLSILGNIASILSYFYFPSISLKIIYLSVAFFTFLLIFSFIKLYKYVNKQLADAGTNNIKCAYMPYIYYKIRNNNLTFLKIFHRDLYHCIEELKNNIQYKQREKYHAWKNKNPLPQLTPLELDDIKESVGKLLKNFHLALYDAFHLDVSISLFQIAEDNNNLILTRSLFQPSNNEGCSSSMRKDDTCYIIHQSEDVDMDVFYSKAYHYNERHGTHPYQKNCVFDYILSTQHNAWLSNNLSIDNERRQFFSSSVNYRTFYNSLAAFAIVPPGCNDNRRNVIKGILTFDTIKTNRFSEEECTLMMGLMAHIVFDILNSLNYVTYE